MVAAGACWSGAAGIKFILAAARQIFGCYGFFAALGVVLRGLRAEQVIAPPKRSEWCLAHLGVAPAARSRGIGADLIQHLLTLGRDPPRDPTRTQNAGRAVLDVAVTNPRAQFLYERLGFAVTRERPSRLARAEGRVPDHRRMERVL